MWIDSRSGSSFEGERLQTANLTVGNFIAGSLTVVCSVVEKQGSQTFLPSIVFLKSGH